MKGLSAPRPLQGIRKLKADFDKIPLTPRGPERFQALRAPGEYAGGPGEPPDGFVVSGTSASEWPPYWACWILFGLPKSLLRQPPYEGDHGPFSYQKSVKNILGHSFASDFYLKPGRFVREPVVVRIQTEHWHIFARSEIQAFDRRQRQGVEANYRVIDIYDYLFLGDKSGASIIKWMKLAMAGIEPSVLPMSTRHARKSRQK